MEKKLKFTGNRVENAANAFIDVLKYSDQTVDYPSLEDIDPWPGKITNLIWAILKNTKFSELSSVIMYTQQSARFKEDSELLLGIGMVEMRHYDVLTDLVLKMDPEEPVRVFTTNPNIEIGLESEEALKLALASEELAIKHYDKILYEINADDDLYSRTDSLQVIQCILKIKADEVRHVNLLKEALGIGKTSKGVTVIIK